MKKMVKKTVITEITWMKNATLAYFSHDNRNCSFTWREAVKKDTREIKEAVNASKTKKCPNCPGNKCSPSNFMLIGDYCRETVFSSCFLSSLYLEGHFNNMSSQLNTSSCILPFNTTLSLCSSSAGFTFL